MAMASSVLFYTSTQSTVSSSCPSSAASYLSRPTPMAAVGVAVYAAPSRALLDEHTRVAKEVSRGDAAARVTADLSKAAVAAVVLDLSTLVSWDQKAVFSELIKISNLIQETYLEITSLCMQQPDLDTSLRSRFASVCNALQSLTKISDIGIAPHPDNLFVVLCMFKQLTELFSLTKQKFLLPPIMEEIQSTELITDDLSVRFDPTLRALSSAVRRTLELLEVWILRYDSEEVPHGGSVHEITRYLMMHINLLLEHGSLLAIVLNACRDAGEAFPCTASRIKGMHTTNGIVGVLIHHLGTTLDKQSRRYQVAALQWLFLGNNMHFVLQQKEVLEMLGDDWVSKHRDKLGICISRYLDTSWVPVLSCLQTKSVMIPVCFKQPALSRFSLKFEETYSTQKAWKIEDPLLRKHMRRAIIGKLMPTYRSYLEKHQQKALKLMKYTPEDLKEQLSDLFEG